MSTELMSEEQNDVLLEMCKIKREILNKLPVSTCTGVNEYGLVLRTTESIEKTIFKLVGLQNQVAALDNDKSLTEIVAEILSAVEPKTNLPYRGTIPELPNSLVPTDIVVGELDVSGTVINYNDILSGEPDGNDS